MQLPDHWISSCSYHKEQIIFAKYNVSFTLGKIDVPHFSLNICLPCRSVSFFWNALPLQPRLIGGKEWLVNKRRGRYFLNLSLGISMHSVVFELCVLSDKKAIACCEIDQWVILCSDCYLFKRNLPN